MALLNRRSRWAVAAVCSLGVPAALLVGAQPASAIAFDLSTFCTSIKDASTLEAAVGALADQQISTGKASGGFTEHLKASVKIAGTTYPQSYTVGMDLTEHRTLVRQGIAKTAHTPAVHIDGLVDFATLKAYTRAAKQSGFTTRNAALKRLKKSVVYIVQSDLSITEDDYARQISLIGLSSLHALTGQTSLASSCTITGASTVLIHSSYMAGSGSLVDDTTLTLSPGGAPLTERSVRSDTTDSTSPVMTTASNSITYARPSVGRATASTLVAVKTWQSAIVRGSLPVVRKAALKQARTAVAHRKGSKARIKAIRSVVSSRLLGYNELLALDDLYAHKVTLPGGAKITLKDPRTKKTGYFRLRLKGSKVVSTTNMP